MSAAQLGGAIQSVHRAMRDALEESKEDMGVLDRNRPAPKSVLKNWDSLRSPAQQPEPYSFDSFWRETGT